MLKESGQHIVRGLDSLINRTDQFIEHGFGLYKQMKSRRIKDIKQVDAYYQRLIDKVERQRALVKLKYNDCFKMEEARINQELENFQKHMSLINFNKETVQQTVDELSSSNHISTDQKIQGSEISNKLDNFKQMQEELELQTRKLQEVQVSFPHIQMSMEGYDDLLKQLESLIQINHNKYLMSDKKIAFFGDTNKVMLLDLKKEEWSI